MKKTKVIRELQKKFNECDIVKDEYIVEISGINKDEMITLSIFERETEELLFDLQVYYEENIYDLVILFINQIYEDYINQLEKITRSWSAFSKQKARSLRLWSERKDENKIIEINKEIIDRYTQMENAKKQLEFYKKFVCMFYAIKNQLKQAI